MARARRRLEEAAEVYARGATGPPAQPRTRADRPARLRFQGHHLIYLQRDWYVRLVVSEDLRSRGFKCLGICECYPTHAEFTFVRLPIGLHQKPGPHASLQAFGLLAFAPPLTGAQSPSPDGTFGGPGNRVCSTRPKFSLNSAFFPVYGLRWGLISILVACSVTGSMFVGCKSWTARWTRRNESCHENERVGATLIS
jgi:hypothetical protein